MNFDSKALAGIAMFVPALTLLANQGYVTSLLHVFLPSVNPDMVAVIVTPIVAYAGYLLLHAQPPTATPPSTTVTVTPASVSTTSNP